MLPFDDAALDALREEGDPAADAVVATVYAQGKEAVRALNAYTRGLEQNRDGDPSGYPEVLQELLTSTDPIGTAAGGWDEALVQAGADLPFHYAVPLAIVLQLGTMPVLYAARRGVEVIGFTGRLKTEANRRSVETAQMVFDVNRRGGLQPEGCGRRSCQRVRLMHASVRYFIQRSGRWDPELGVPINQEDLLGTLYSFSVLIVDGITRMGGAIPETEAEAFYQRWRAAGELMGIRPEIIAPDLATARRHYERIQSRQFGPSPTNAALTEAWIRENHKSVLGLVSEEQIGEAMRFFIGTDAADALSLPGTPEDGRFARAHRRVFRKMDRLFPRGSRRRQAKDTATTEFIRSWYLAERGPRRPTFALLEGLRDRRASPRSPAG